jgi:hypothetical protein
VRVIDIRRADDGIHYYVVARFNQQAYRVIRYLNPPRTDLELFRPGEKFKTKAAAMQRLGELAKCQHRAERAKPPHTWVCIVQTSDDTWGVYLGPEFLNPMETGTLVRVCPSYKMASHTLEQYREI